MKINFNLQNVKSYSTAPSLIPAGEYVVKIIKEEQAQTQSGDSALVFDYQIETGDFRGVILRDWLNIENRNQTARELAQARLKAIGEAVGLSMFNDTRELFNRPFAVRVSVRSYTDRNGTERQTNQIDGYFAANATAQQPTTNQPAPFWN